MAKEITKNKIEAERWYSLLDIAGLNLFSWCKDIKTVRAWIKRDKKTKNILRVVITGKGRTQRYKILGRHIQEFVEAVENGHYL